MTTSWTAQRREFPLSQEVLLDSTNGLVGFSLSKGLGFHLVGNGV